MTFKTLSTPLISIPNKSDSLNYAQVKKLVPKGYVVMTTEMARLALKYRNDAISFKYQISQKDSLLAVKEIIIQNQNGQVSQSDIALKIAKRKIFWNTVETWTLRIAVIFLGGKQIKAW